MADDAFKVQGAVRRPWRDYLDSLVNLRPDLHRYCCRLTGNVWDGEDLVQETLLRVFGLMGKLDADLENPRAYLIRTATNLWIDRMRRAAREQAILELERGEESSVSPRDDGDARPAAAALFTHLHPQERAAIVMKDVFDLSLEETAALLHTSAGAIKAALNRARGRLSSRRKTAGFATPPRELVEKFMLAMRAKDLDALRALCSADLTVELVGGAQMEGFDNSRMFFEFAHFVMPGLGESPRWDLVEYENEPVVIGYRTLDGLEGLNEIHRIEELDGRIARVRCYCFAPDTLRTIAAELGIAALPRPYRSPG